MNIAYIGNFTTDKGSRIFTDLILKYNDKHQWFIFGYIGDVASFNLIKEKITLQKKYPYNGLSNYLFKYKIDLCLVLSTWAETFSLTFFESIISNIPTITNELGFPYFLLKSKYNYFYDSQNPIESITNIINSVNENPEPIRSNTKIISKGLIKRFNSSLNLYKLLSE